MILPVLEPVELCVCVSDGERLWVTERVALSEFDCVCEAVPVAEGVVVSLAVSVELRVVVPLIEAD